MKPCNLIEFRDDELMEDFITDLSNIAYETIDDAKYGVLVQYLAKSNSGKTMEFTSYLKESVLQDIVNSRAYLLR